MTALRLVQVSQLGTPGDPDLADFEHWQRELRGLRPTTIRVRVEVLTRLSTFVGKPLRDATEADLLRWEQTAVAGGAAEARRAYVSHVKSFYRWAKAAGIIIEDPSSRLTDPRLNRPLSRPVPDDVLRRAVALAKPRIRLMTCSAPSAGCAVRRSPACTGPTCGRRTVRRRCWSARRRAGGSASSPSPASSSRRWSRTAADAPGRCSTGMTWRRST